MQNVTGLSVKVTETGCESAALNNALYGHLTEAMKLLSVSNCYLPEALELAHDLDELQIDKRLQKVREVFFRQPFGLAAAPPGAIDWT
jgi:hypothetical protein